MRLYQVEITTIAVIAADDKAHALAIAESDAWQIFSDDCSPRIELDREVTSLCELRHGWDGECIPYGGDGNTRLKALLPNAPPASVVPDAETVGQAVSDYFAALINGDGTLAFDPCSSDDIDALVAAMLAAAPEVKP